MSTHNFSVQAEVQGVNLLLCSRGCGATLNPVNGEAQMRNGQPAPPVCAAVAAAAAEGAQADLAGLGLTAEIMVNLMRGARLPSRVELQQEKTSGSIRFGDPLMADSSKAEKEGSSVVDGLTEMESLFALRLVTLASAALDAIQALRPAVRDALPQVDLTNKLGADLQGGNARSLPAVLAEVLTAAVTVVGLGTLRAYAVIDGKRWKSSSAPCLRFDAAGRATQTSFYWNTLQEVVAADKATLMPSALCSAAVDAGAALQKVHAPGKVLLHGSGASILKLAPTIGMLRSAIWNQAAHAPLAAFWSQWRAALAAAAVATRKEFKAFALAPATHEGGGSDGRANLTANVTAKFIPQSNQSAQNTRFIMDGGARTPSGAPLNTVGGANRNYGGPVSVPARRTCQTCGKMHGGVCYALARVQGARASGRFGRGGRGNPQRG
eukprot:TRINITY_DN11417_c0_g1_i1.p1 TRINITY_DN11417_c0_g1~~TRINITY_DN11417_c0_g1_i1.p1  ORF type:complete len:437 (-),score=13.18 TRINITY_DN11417_c0_g1_i1:1216-2526(-)